MKRVAQPQKVVALFLAVALLASWWHFAKKTSSPDQRRARIPPLARLEPQLVSIFSLGTPRLYQSFLARWSESIFTDSTLTSEQANQLFSDYDILARHEPKSEWFYLGPCLVFSEKLNRPDLCFSITGYGQRAMPTSWKIPVLQAFIEQQRLRNSERSRFFLEIAAKKPGAPEDITTALLGTSDASTSFDPALLKKLLGAPGFERYSINFSGG